jgi:flavin-dependent dehydrogenase
MADKQNASDDKYDVAIIGSGPSGSAAAKALSGHGLKNILIEKAKLPRYKMCSGVLSPSSVKFVTEHFGTLPEHVISKPEEVIGARIYTGLDRHFVDVRFSDVDQGPGHPELGMSVKRTEFDYWMATSTDATIVDNCRFNGIAATGSLLSIQVEHNGVHRLIAAKFIVGADGVLSRVRNAISPEFDKTIRFIPNYEEWYTGEIDLEPKWLNVFFDEKLTRFFASVMHKDGKIIVVNGAKRPYAVKEYFQFLIDHLKHNFGFAIKEKLAGYGCAVHDMAATNNFHTGDGNILLVGEAGGFFRVLDEGISSALITGNAAGKAIIESMETGRAVLSCYREKVSAELKQCYALNCMLKEQLGMNPCTR